MQVSDSLAHLDNLRLRDEISGEGTDTLLSQEIPLKLKHQHFNSQA